MKSIKFSKFSSKKKSLLKFNFNIISRIIKFVLIRLLGKPDSNIWPDIKNLPNFKESFPNFKGKSFEEIVPNLDSNGINLFSMMLAYDPNKRITAKQALLHVI